MDYDRKKGSFVERHPWFVPTLAVGAGFLFMVATVATVLFFDAAEDVVVEEYVKPPTVESSVFASVKDAYAETAFLSSNDYMTTLATWEVDGVDLVDVEYGDTGLFADLQVDAALHAYLWDQVYAVFAGDALNQVSHFEIATDGVDGTFAQIVQSSRDPEEWILTIDPLDAYGENGSLNREAFLNTVAHEFAHLITVMPDQLDVSQEIFDTVTQAEYEAAIIRGRGQCDNYMLNEGCSTDGSYVNLFYQEYWTQAMMDEVLRIADLEGDAQEAAALDFYDLYYWDFLNDYAATNPEEDFAESFAYYVTGQDTSGSEVYLQKTRFFAQFPEFVQLKARIEAAL